MKMELFSCVADKLKELNIQYQLVEHEPALTTERADKFIEGIEGVRTKTMFLTNKKKRYTKGGRIWHHLVKHLSTNEHRDGRSPTGYRRLADERCALRSCQTST